MADVVLPSPEAWDRVGRAVRAVEGGNNRVNNLGNDAFTLPAVVFKVTGAISGGYYPGKLLAWDQDAEDWIETEDCYIKAG